MTDTERADFEELMQVLATAAEKDRATAEHHAARNEATQEAFHWNRHRRNIRYLDACRAFKRKVTAKETAKKNRAGFYPPTVREAAEYAKEIELPPSEAQKFHDFYTSKGWKVGAVSMSDWQAAMRNWKRKWRETNPEMPKAVTAIATEDPAGWREFLQSKGRKFKAYRFEEEYVRTEFLRGQKK